MSTLAAGDAEAVRCIRTGLREGTLADVLPPLPAIPVVGVGHSMVACLTAMVQADRSLYVALVLLGYSVDTTNVHEESITGDSLTERLSQTEQGVRAAAGSTWDDGYVLMPRELLHDLFHHPVAPAEVIAADYAAQSRLPRWCPMEVTRIPRHFRRPDRRP